MSTMSYPKCVLMMVAALLVLPALVRAQDLPSGREVLDRYIEVTGGRDAYAGAKSRITNATIEIPQVGVKGDFIIYQQAPDKGYVVTDLPGVGRIEQGYDGQIAWERNPITGPRLLEGQEKDNLARSLVIGAELEPEKFYETIETVGQEDVDGKPAYKLEMTSRAGTKETRFYDKESGLLVRTEGTQQTQMGEVKVTGTPGEYKEMGGIKMPTRVTQSMAGQTITLTINSVERDAEIPEEKFQLPDEVKELVKQKETGDSDPTTPPR